MCLYTKHIILLHSMFFLKLESWWFLILFRGDERREPEQKREERREPEQKDAIHSEKKREVRESGVCVVY